MQPKPTEKTWGHSQWLFDHQIATQEYAIGRNDVSFLVFCVLIFIGLRVSCIKYALVPLAKRLRIVKPRDVLRFSEQAWLLCYYSVFWTLGMYIYCTSKYFLNRREMYTDWPTRELPGATKFYILGQWAFWLQQLIIVNIEERRRDHWQMVAHHLVTILLIYTSYMLHLTRAANVMLVLMDVVDIFFPLAKCLKYAGFSTLCDIMFGIFMLSWFLARHVLYLIIFWSAWTDGPGIVPKGCYQGSQDALIGPTPLPKHGWVHIFEPFWNPSGRICYNETFRWVLMAALGFLQLLMAIWFVLIVRVAIRVLKGLGADDIRSDDESEEDAELEGAAETEDNHKDVDMHRKQPLTCLSRQHSRKELLDRIGCEKQVD
ncbi:TLC domain-containing protein [Aspergillus germanicus]